MWYRRQFREPVGPGAVVGFLGDVILNDPQGRTVQIGPGVLAKLRECDLVVANQEGPLTTAPVKRLGGGTRLSASPACVAQLKEMNVRLANLANNHTMDHGLAGLLETLETLHGHGIMTHGAGRTLAQACEPCVLDLPCGRLALVAYASEPPFASENSPGPPRMHMGRAVRVVSSLRQSGHIVCVQYHGGVEFRRIPRPERRRMFRELVRAGAHMVIGNHPHVFQGMEEVGGSAIVHSLGNVYLVTRKQPPCFGADVGLLLAFEIDASGPFAARYAFTGVDRAHARVFLLDGGPRERARWVFEELSGLMSDDSSYACAWRHQCLMVLAGRIWASPTRLPGAIGRLARTVRSLLTHGVKAPWCGPEREITLAAIGALPSWLLRRRASRWYAAARNIVPFG